MQARPVASYLSYASFSSRTFLEVYVGKKLFYLSIAKKVSAPTVKNEMYHL